MGNKRSKQLTTQHNNAETSTATSNPQNGEKFPLIWLDSDVHKIHDNLMTLEKLKNASTSIETFDATEKFEEWFNRPAAVKSKDKKFVMIVSGQLGKVVVPQIHASPRLVAIYVHCMDKKTIETWANQYKKIRAVLTDPTELVKVVKSSQHEIKMLDDLTSLPMSIFDPSSLATHPETSSTGINGNFLWMQLFIEVLLRMNHSEEDRMELVSFCKITSTPTQTKLNFIEDFETGYRRDDALEWYTRDSCLYRTLNEALRFQNIDILIIFRVFIADIYRQLKRAQLASTDLALRLVYRGQRMSNEELDRIKSSIGLFVSINSFLSTSADLEVANLYLTKLEDVCELSPGMSAVLLEIEINPSVLDTKPYANISDFSAFPLENEVLFMVGSIFKIDSVRNTDHYHTIKLKLCNDNDHDLEVLSSYLKDKIPCKPTLVSLGNLLGDMGEYGKAAKCYQRQLNKLTNKNSYAAGCCYTGLGVVATMSGNYNSAVQYHEKALSINQATRNNHGNIAGSYSNLASALKYRKDFKTATRYYRECLKIQKRMHGSDSLEVAKTYVNMGHLYGEQELHGDALKCHSDALKIQEKHLPANHFNIARTYGNIGVVHHQLKECNKALLCYQKSLSIFLQSLPDTHRCLGITYQNLGEVYEDTGELHLAIQNYVKADTVYHHSLPSTHPARLENQQYLERVNRRVARTLENLSGETFSITDVIILN